MYLFDYILFDVATLKIRLTLHSQYETFLYNYIHPTKKILNNIHCLVNKHDIIISSSL